MEIFTEQGAALLARWVHILAGITWIGLLYYFNFVQVPFFAATEAEVRSAAIRGLVPRALAWFRYAALVTFLAGVTIIGIRILESGWGVLWSSSYGVSITSGMTLGTLMFLNVWGVIWPNQKIVIASTEAVAGGGSANPRAADAGRRAFLASRTNVVFSIPMVFFMATASHLPLFGEAASSQKLSYALLGGIVVLALQANALTGLTGGMKKYLEKIETVLVSGVVLLVFLYAALQLAIP